MAQYEPSRFQSPPFVSVFVLTTDDVLHVTGCFGHVVGKLEERMGGFSDWEIHWQR